MSGRELYEAQCRADRAHHEGRVRWLEVDEPRWACGTPVSQLDRKTLLRQSHDYLRNPSGHMNHCHCEPRCGTEENA